MAQFLKTKEGYDLLLSPSSHNIFYDNLSQQDLIFVEQLEANCLAFVKNIMQECQEDDFNTKKDAVLKQLITTFSTEGDLPTELELSFMKSKVAFPNVSSDTQNMLFCTFLKYVFDSLNTDDQAKQATDEQTLVKALENIFYSVIVKSPQEIKRLQYAADFSKTNNSAVIAGTSITIASLTGLLLMLLV